MIFWWILGYRVRSLTLEVLKTFNLERLVSKLALNVILTIEFGKTNCTFALYIKNQVGNSIGLWKWVVEKKKIKWRFIILGS